MIGSFAPIKGGRAIIIVVCVKCAICLLILVSVMLKSTMAFHQSSPLLRSAVGSTKSRLTRFVRIDAHLCGSKQVHLHGQISMGLDHQQGKQAVAWFRNDLRIDDNPTLVHATEPSRKIEQVLPVYCFDPRHYERTKYGTQKTGIYRARFLIESVLDLRKSLEESGSGLYVALGKPEDVLPKLMQEGFTSSNPIELVLQEEVTSEELAIDKAVENCIQDLKEVDLSVTRIWGHTLYHPRDLPMTITQTSSSFTPWRKKVEDKQTKIRKAFPAKAIKERLGNLKVPELEKAVDMKAGFDFIPTLQDLGFSEEELVADSRSAMTFLGGETEGLKRVKHYLWDSNSVATYFETRNGMIGPDYSTKFSPWLAYGCISPRRIYSELQKYEGQRVKNKSTYWVVFELMWRDYFRFNFLKNGSKIFQTYGLQGAKNRDIGQEWRENEELFQRWVEGKTGWPLVDANMRELAATGWMSNRGRQNVGSFLCLDLQLDWRKGAYYFEEKLLDYDVCSNWGNWHAIAGLSGGRINRFNIVKQSKDYDPEGEYIRQWLPELKSVPAPMIHEPWKMSKADQQKYGAILGSDYPFPVQINKFRPQQPNSQQNKQKRNPNNKNKEHRNNRNNRKTVAR